jgi:radical SAM enzyme (TIGR01210 family)
MPVKCDVVGGGSIRGAHNCGTCDHSVLDAIAQFSLSQKTSVFNNLTCSCQEQWRDQLASETLSFGSLVDYGRWES